MVDFKELEWKIDKLYYGKQFLGEVKLDKKHKDCYRIYWPDGTKSRDTDGYFGFYNYTRAKMNLMEYALAELNSDAPSKIE